MTLTVEQKKLIREVSKLQKELFSKAHNNTFTIAKLTEYKKVYISQMDAVVKLIDEYNKMLRELEYTKICHFKTKLTDSEMSYCANDVKEAILCTMMTN